MSNNLPNQDQTVIACDPYALTPEQRTRWMAFAPQLYGSFQEIQDLPDGYAFRLPDAPEMLILAAEDLTMERLCCPFVRYTLEVEPNKGPFWLRMTGGEGVKEFLRMSFEAANLINEDVAKSAGFSVAARAELTSVDVTIETVNTVNARFADMTNASEK